MMRVKKQAFSLIYVFTVVLLMSLCLRTVVSASDIKARSLYDGSKDPVTDDADLLSDSQEDTIRNEIIRIREKYNFDVVVLTVNGTGGKTATEYADDFYDHNGFGMGEDNSGILLLVDMGDRAWATSTAGRGITYFNEDTLYEIEDRIIPYLSSGDYYGAFSTYVTSVEDRVRSRIAAETFDLSDVTRSVFIGFLLALIPLIIQLAGMKSVKQKAGAGDYHTSKGLLLSNSNDQFIRHAVTRTPIPKETKSGGGGSITHTSSSGVSHGGHSGHF